MGMRAEIATKIEGALEEAQVKEQDTMLLRSHSRVSSSAGWEYDVAVADSGFHSDVKTAIELPMKSLNIELQARYDAQGLSALSILEG